MRPGVGDAAGDRLADPPRGVRRELEALAPVELLDGVHQPEVALLDEVEQGQPGRLVLLGDGDDEAQVGLHELALGLLAVAGRATQLAATRRRRILAAVVERLDGLLARLDRLGQADLVILGQQGVLANVGEIQPNEIFVIAVNAIFGHHGSLSYQPAAGVSRFSPVPTG